MNIDYEFYEECFKSYYLRNEKNFVNILNKKLYTKKDLLDFANIFFLDNLKKCIYLVNKCGFYKASVDIDGSVILTETATGIVSHIYTQSSYKKNKEKINNAKIKAVVEKFLIDIKDGKKDNYSESEYSNNKKFATEYYIDNLIYDNKNELKKIYEDHLMSECINRNKKLKNKVREFTLNNLELQKKIFDYFLYYYPLDKIPKAPNSTIAQILISKVKELMPIKSLFINLDFIKELISKYQYYIVDENIKKQFNEGYKKLNDDNYDNLKYAFDLYEGVRYNDSRLKKMYPDNYKLLVKRAKKYCQKYLNQEDNKLIDKKIDENNNLEKIDNLSIKPEYLSIFFKLSQIQTKDLAMSYLIMNNIDSNELREEFIKFKIQMKDKYSLLVIKDIEEKVNYFYDKKTKIMNAYDVINNVCKEIVINPDNIKEKYFKELGIKKKEIETIEDITRNFFPELFKRYNDKIKIIEKDQIDKILNKIKELGNDFTIFDYSQLSNLNITKFFETLYENYPDKTEKIEKIMEMDFAKALTDIDEINVDDYLKFERYESFNNDLYKLTDDDKNQIVRLLKKYNLPINNQTCKLAAKKYLNEKINNVTVKRKG